MGQRWSQPENCGTCQHSHKDSDVDTALVSAVDHDDLIHVPFIPECEVFYEGGPDAFELEKGCQKNPGHPNFIPINELTMEHLPVGYQTPTVMSYIKQQSKKTVKITVKYTSVNRPATYPNSSAPYPYSSIKGTKRASRCGTGVFFLGPVEKSGRCPCHLCNASNNPETKYLLGVVSTAAHVIFDDAEAKCSTFDLFYDSETDKDNMMCLYGVGLFKDNLYNNNSNNNNNNRSGGKHGDDDVGFGNNFDNGCDIDGNNGVDLDKEEGIIKRCHQDRIWVLCATHNLTLLDKMDNNEIPLNDGRALPRKYGVIFSHPHGLSKRISFGQILKHRFPLSANQPVNIPYTYKSGVKCRQRKMCECSTASIIKSLKTMKSFQQFLKLDAPLKHGAEYKLKYTISILPPPNAIFLSESVFQKGCSNYWVRFFPGTKFALQDGEDLIYHVLPDIEFNFFDADFNFYTGLSYATYAIDTCPGSSGAKVLFTELKEFHGQHSGALSDGTNRSALDFY